MPVSAKSPCRQSGCRALVDRPGYCEQHKREKHRGYNSSPKRQADQKFYKGRLWLAVRKQHLQNEPLCRTCRKVGKLTEATHVDHIIPRSIGGSEYDETNLQSLCMSCHSSKTRIEETIGTRGVG